MNYKTDEIVNILINEKNNSLLKKKRLMDELKLLDNNIHLNNRDLGILCDHMDVTLERIFDGHKTARYYTCNICNCDINMNSIKSSKKRKIN